MPSTAVTILGDIRRSALDSGCTRIRLFSQVVGSVKDSIDRQGSGGGVCRELAVQWLGGKKSGHDYLGTLLGVGGTVNEAAMADVVQGFQAMGSINRLEQRKYTEHQLEIARLKVLAKTEVKNELVGSVGAWLCSNELEGDYRFFGIRGAVNHATAICLVSGAESFCDPNLGEFEFHKKPAHLMEFLVTHIFPTGGNGMGQYIGRPNKNIDQIERIRCA